MVFEANTHRKKEDTTWKAMKSWVRKCNIFLFTINFEVSWPFLKMCNAMQFKLRFSSAVVRLVVEPQLSVGSALQQPNKQLRQPRRRWLLPACQLRQPRRDSTSERQLLLHRASHSEQHPGHQLQERHLLHLEQVHSLSLTLGLPCAKLHQLIFTVLLV